MVEITPHGTSSLFPVQVEDVEDVDTLTLVSQDLGDLQEELHLDHT